MKKLRIGVFMGGKSIEREVSFNSGRTVCDHLDSERYDSIPIFQRSDGKLFLLPSRFLHRGKISDFEHKLDTEAEKLTWDGLKTLIDFVYIAAHGRYAEDGILQGFLEVLGIPYLGSKVFASALGMDKIIQKEVLKSNGIGVPHGFGLSRSQIRQVVNKPSLLTDLIVQHQLPFPCIVKPQHEGSSLGISKVSDPDELLGAIARAANIDEHTLQGVVIEQALSGMEFTCIVITDYKNGKPIALVPTEVIKEHGSDIYDYEQKYMPGRALKFTPARCAPAVIEKIQQTSIKVMQCLAMENIARIDGFVTQDGSLLITDPNTLAGMAPSSFIFRQAAEYGMSHTAFINHLIETELARYSMIDQIESPENAGTQEPKMRVAVLFGGRSHEREISLESGRNVIYKLSPKKYSPVPIFVDRDLKLYMINQSLLVRNSTKEISLGVNEDMRISWDTLTHIADFVFIALHGDVGENGAVQGALEMLGIPYNGSSVLASALCNDKYKTCRFLDSQGFDVPRGILLDKQSWQAESADTLIEKLGSLPLIVKPHNDGCSVLVAKAKTKDELLKAIEEIFADGKEYALVEECIVGMELTCGVIGNESVQALPPSQAISLSDVLSIEEKFLPGAGENQTPAPLPQATLEFVQETLARVYTTLDCRGYARIDCFYQTAAQSPTAKERVVIIEVNTLPGMTPATCIFHQAAEIGLKPMEFIDLIISLGLEEHSKKALVMQPETQGTNRQDMPILQTTLF